MTPFTTGGLPTWLTLPATLLVLLVCGALADDWTYGRATYYDDNQQGSCKFYADIPEWYGAWPDTLAGFDVSCGSCWEVSCVNSDFSDGFGESMQRSSVCYDENKSVIIKIVDSCPCVHANFYSNQRWCCGDMKHLDIGRRTMEELADLKWGVIGLKWRQASCDNLGPRYISDTGNQQIEPPAADSDTGSNSDQSKDNTDDNYASSSDNSSNDNSQGNKQDSTNDDSSKGQPDSSKDSQNQKGYTVSKKGGTTTINYWPQKDSKDRWNAPKRQQSFGDLLSNAFVGDSSSKQKSFGDLFSGALLGQRT